MTVALVSGACCFLSAYPRFKHAGSITQMRDDYTAYCKGEGGTFHSDPLMNQAAFWEWVLIGVLVSFAPTYTYSQLLKGKQDQSSNLNAPMLST